MSSDGQEFAFFYANALSPLAATTKNLRWNFPDTSRLINRFRRPCETLDTGHRPAISEIPCVGPSKSGQPSVVTPWTVAPAVHSADGRLPLSSRPSATLHRFHPLILFLAQCHYPFQGDKVWLQLRGDIILEHLQSCGRDFSRRQSRCTMPPALRRKWKSSARYRLDRYRPEDPKAFGHSRFPVRP